MNEEIPMLAFKQPFHLGMTIYQLDRETGIRAIATSEAEHEIEFVEADNGRIRAWGIGRKGSGCSNDLLFYAASPLDAWKLATDRSFAMLRQAENEFRAEVADATEALAHHLTVSG